jgi:V/A-type H+-transporting ATPase subunit D
MAIKFQYNKVSLQEMQKQLKVRLDTLPVLKLKEAILRAEAEKAKKKMAEMETNISTKIKGFEYMDMLWQEFPQDAITVKEVKISMKNIAGVKTPQFEEVEFELKPLCLFNLPFWTFNGIALLKEMIGLSIEKKIILQRAELLEAARKKTTQKVNLYEKVQVPGYADAISKIKKFMNDEESLGKAVQKIMKKRILSI